MNLFRLVLAVAITFAMGKLVSKMRLPGILGWLIAGMILGPHLLQLVSQDMIDTKSITFITNVFETLAGVLIGSELLYSELKEMGTKLVGMAIIQSLFTFLVVTCGFAITFYLLKMPLYPSVLFGGIALATAPAPSISIVNEYGAKGPVAKTLVPLAVLDDLVGIVIFFTTISLVASNLNGSGFQILPILIMILGPVTLGGLCGFVTGQIANHKKELSQTTIFIIGIFTATCFGYLINQFVLPSPSMSYFMIGLSVAGVYINIVDFETQQATLSQSAPLVGFGLMFTIFMMGTPLDYKALANAGLFTAIYIIMRFIGKYFGNAGAAKLYKQPDTVVKYLGLTMLPHSGVSIFFTGIAYTNLVVHDPQSAILIQGTIAAAAIINEIIAVILAKKAFEMANEIS